MDSREGTEDGEMPQEPVCTHGAIPGACVSRAHAAVSAWH